MLASRKVKFEAKKKMNENLTFRSFLKCNADEETLDRQFKELHEELFGQYDCSRCRNCCKMYYGSLSKEEMKKSAVYFNMAEKEFIDAYLMRKDEYENEYQTKHIPCDFLSQDGTCKLGEYKPENCKKYPYTSQPERLHSLYSVLEAVEVCPVAFEIYERLKKMYCFRF